MRDTFDISNTVQFTFVSSVAPDSAPIFKVTGIENTVVSSVTAIQSDTTHFYTLYTMPSSQGVYMGEWFAQKTVAGSVYNFNKKFLFSVRPTRREL